MADYEIRRNAGIGSSSLIVIFIVLCLTTFGLLSLGNAKNDALLSERNAEAVQVIKTSLLDIVTRRSISADRRPL